jgi:hypothetical protein
LIAIGDNRSPLNTADFSSYLIDAQASKVRGSGGHWDELE